jgi:hypothetical protein
MSRAIDPITSVKAIDPRVNFTQPSYLIQQGAAQSTAKRIIALSYNDSVITFSCPPPNQRIAVDRKVFIGLPIRLTFTGTAVGPTLLQPGSNDAPRSYGMSKVCSNIQVVLNNTTISSNVSDYIDAVLHYNNELKTRQFELSGTPTMLDTMQDYAQYAAAFAPIPPAGPGAGSVFPGSRPLGSARNPLANYGENSTENARGGFTTYRVVSDNGAVAVVDVLFYEPLFISPLMFGEHDAMGLYGIQTFDITLNLGDLSRAWSHSALGENITSCVGSITSANVFGQPTAYFNYLTPQMDQNLSPNGIYTYPYYSIDRFPTTVGTLLPYNSVDVSSNNLQLNSIPRRIYIYARRANSNLSFRTTDTYARIDRMSVNFNNKSGLLSGADSHSLYQTSVRNGLCSSWDQWNTYQGSIMCIDFARDMSLSPIEVPGVQNQYQFQVDVTITNLHPSETIPFQLWIVVVSEGSIINDNGNMTPQIGIVAPEEVLTDPSIRQTDYYLATMGATFYGGSFMDTVKKYGFKTLRGVNAALPALKAAAPFLPGGPIVSSALGLAEKYIPQLLALGVSKEKAEEIVGSGVGEAELRRMIRGAGVVGSGVMGGRAASRSRMSRRLM